MNNNYDVNFPTNKLEKSLRIKIEYLNPQKLFKSPIGEKFNI